MIYQTILFQFSWVHFPPLHPSIPWKQRFFSLPKMLHVYYKQKSNMLYTLSQRLALLYHSITYTVWNIVLDCHFQMTLVLPDLFHWRHGCILNNFTEINLTITFKTVTYLNDLSNHIISIFLSSFFPLTLL
jgi:hypothetical protein